MTRRFSLHFRQLVYRCRLDCSLFPHLQHSADSTAPIRFENVPIVACPFHISPLRISLFCISFFCISPFYVYPLSVYLLSLCLFPVFPLSVCPLAVVCPLSVCSLSVCPLSICLLSPVSPGKYYLPSTTCPHPSDSLNNWY